MSDMIASQGRSGESPWPLNARIAMLLWEYCWMAFCVWTPKPANPWRLFWLRLFGAKVEGKPFVHQRARINIPWNLTLHEGACIGDRSNIYALGKIEIGAGAVVAQEAYICTGTHDFSDPELPLRTAKITVGEGAFIGARAFVLPGVMVGARAVVGACSVVTKDVGDGDIVAGNPASRRRRISIAPIAAANSATV